MSYLVEEYEGGNGESYDGSDDGSEHGGRMHPEVNKIFNAYLRSNGLNYRHANHIMDHVEMPAIGSGPIDYIKKHKKKILAALGIAATAGLIGAKLLSKKKHTSYPDISQFRTPAHMVRGYGDKCRGYKELEDPHGYLEDEGVVSQNPYSRLGNLGGAKKKKVTKRKGKKNSIASQVMAYKHKHNISLAEAWAAFR